MLINKTFHWSASDFITFVMRELAVLHLRAQLC